MKKAIKIVIIVVAIALLLFVVKVLWSYFSRPPIKYIAEEVYFVCNKKKALYGGIAGKGPFRKYPSKKEWCWRSEWEKIDRKTFKYLATEWYGVVWSEEIPWWRNN